MARDSLRFFKSYFHCLTFLSFAMELKIYILFTLKSPRNSLALYSGFQLLQHFTLFLLFFPFSSSFSTSSLVSPTALIFLFFEVLSDQPSTKCTLTINGTRRDACIHYVRTYVLKRILKKKKKKIIRYTFQTYLAGNKKIANVLVS